MKRYCIFILLGVACFLGSCLPERSGTIASLETPAKAVRAGLALSSHGLGDQSFNDMLYNGLIQAYTRFDIDAVLRIPPDDDEKTLEALFEDMIQKDKCNVILAGEGFLMGPIIYALARKYPDIVFILFDYDEGYHLPNLATAEFAQNEGSFAAGFLAARFSKTKRIGFLGGVDVASVRDFEAGFRQGVQYGDPVCTIITRHISLLPDFSGFSDPKRGYEMAMEMYAEDMDIIYAAAGASGNGIIRAAQESGHYVIGVDSDQDHMAPGYVLTSMLKRLDVALVRLLEYRIAGGLRGESYRFDYRNGGISLTGMEYTKSLFPAALLDELGRVEEMIKNERIAVINTWGK
ncbi:MAG: BMP family ABC transporter substrate-binding protein [Spirochaetota bacterium]|jgi:basic membrane protein A|nr:BMP family ABC transporter substrate-binding protein [Spirochaetota bacterium]